MELVLFNLIAGISRKRVVVKVETSLASVRGATVSSFDVFIFIRLQVESSEWSEREEAKVMRGLLAICCKCMKREPFTNKRNVEEIEATSTTNSVATTWFYPVWNVKRPCADSHCWFIRRRRNHNESSIREFKCIFSKRRTSVISIGSCHFWDFVIRINQTSIEGRLMRVQCIDPFVWKNRLSQLWSWIRKALEPLYESLNFLTRLFEMRHDAPMCFSLRN